MIKLRIVYTTLYIYNIIYIYNIDNNRLHFKATKQMGGSQVHGQMLHVLRPNSNVLIVLRFETPSRASPGLWVSQHVCEQMGLPHYMP